MMLWGPHSERRSRAGTLAAAVALGLILGATAGCDRDPEPTAEHEPPKLYDQPQGDETPRQTARIAEPMPDKAAKAPPPTAPSSALSETLLARFAVANQKVDQVQAMHSEKIATATSPEDARKAQEAAAQAAAMVVNAAGLSMEEYSQVAQRVKNDPELRKKVRSYVEPAQ